MSRVAVILFFAWLHVFQQKSSVVGLRREAGKLEDEARNQNYIPKSDHVTDDSALEPSDDDGALEPFDGEVDVHEDDKEFLDELEASSALHITDQVSNQVTRAGKGHTSSGSPLRRRSYISGGVIGSTGAGVVTGGGWVITHSGSKSGRLIPDLKGYWRQGGCEISESGAISSRSFELENWQTWRDDFMAHCGQECTKNESCVGFAVRQAKDHFSRFHGLICKLTRHVCLGVQTDSSAFFVKPGFCCLASASSTDFCGNCVQESIANGTDWCGRSPRNCATCSGAKWCPGLPTPIVARDESLYVFKRPSLKHSHNSQMDPQVRKGTSGLKTFCYVFDKRRHYAYLQEGSFKRGVQQTCFEAFESTSPPPLAGAMKYCDRRIKHRGRTLSRIEQGDDDGTSDVRLRAAEAKANAFSPTMIDLIDFFQRLLGRDTDRSADTYCFYAFPKKGRYNTERICNAYSKYGSWWSGGGYSYLSTTQEKEMMLPFFL